MKHEKMRQLRADGFTLQKIATAANVSTKTVFQVVGRKGPPRQRRRGNTKRDHKIRELITGGMQQVEVARLYDLSKARISVINKEE